MLCILIVKMYISDLSNIMYINCKNVYISFEKMLYILIVGMYISVLRKCYVYFLKKFIYQF